MKSRCTSTRTRTSGGIAKAYPASPGSMCWARRSTC
jgi:hypothetical protein